MPFTPLLYLTCSVMESSLSPLGRSSWGILSGCESSSSNWGLPQVSQKGSRQPVTAERLPCPDAHTDTGGLDLNKASTFKDLAV